MNRFILKTIACAGALYVAAGIFPSIQLSHPLAPLLAGLVLTLLNVSLRPLLVFVLSPLVLVTAGLAALLIQAWMLMLMSLIVRHSFIIPGFWLTIAVASIVALFDLGTRRLLKNGSLRA